MTIEFTVPGRPVPMARPRVTSRGTFTPKRCRDYKSAVAVAAKAAMRGKEPIEGAIIVNMAFRFAIPKSWSTAKRQEWENGKAYFLSRPDIDNLYKSVTDALIGIVYKDDSQIFAAQIIKSYGGVDEVAVALTSVEHDDGEAGLYATGRTPAHGGAD